MKKPSPTVSILYFLQFAKFNYLWLPELSRMSISKKEPNKNFHLAMQDRSNFLPNLSVECVIFGYHNKELKVLCSQLKNTNRWTLPGGLVGKDENLEDAVHRILEERTSIKGLFLKQFGVFGDKDRSLSKTNFPAHNGPLDPSEAEKSQWILNTRLVSISYYALTEFSKVQPQPSFIYSESGWVNIDELPPMILNHQEMILEALKTLRRQLHHERIGLNLLPEKFTISELQVLYETILNRKLDTRNFVKKIQYLDILTKLDEKKSIGGHRSPTLYKFNKLAYNKALKNEDLLFF